MDPSTLKGKIARMPPIVILSACSTHPLDWSETSSAGAFLTMGAMSVLGTVTPIHARDAAVFVGRLLLRLAEFVPVIAGSGQRWSDVISGLLRMSYVTDLIRVFESEKVISADDHRKIQFEANTLINSESDEWFEKRWRRWRSHRDGRLNESEVFGWRTRTLRAQCGTCIWAARSGS